MNSDLIPTPKVCTRCRGKGFGSWVVEHGICYGCRGVGTREAQLAVKARLAAEAADRAAVEDVSILVGPVADRRAADIAYFEAFVGPDRADWNGSPMFAQVAPGWFIASVRMNVARVLA